MSNRNNRVVIKSFTQMRKRDRRRRKRAVRVLLDDDCCDLSVLHPAIAALFRAEHLASHLVAKTTWGVRL